MPSLGRICEELRKLNVSGNGKDNEDELDVQITDLLFNHHDDVRMHEWW
jgi:hypothetical protein